MTVDPEFQAYVPPITEEEFSQLERNIQQEGCRDPLVVWGEIIVDGHNRYTICTKHQLPFKTVARDFADREAAMDWMDSNQLGRRNLNPDQASILRGRRYNRTKKQGKRTDLTSVQNAQKLTTAEALATQHGVNESTIRRDGKRAEAFDKLQEVAPEQAKAVMAGGKRFNEVRREIRLAEVKEVAALPTDKFRVFYADPPWKYGDQLTEDYGGARWHYPSMSIAELCALPIEAMAQDTAVLFLWVTSPLLYEAFPVIGAWGFKYKACFVWDKRRHNLGHYNSVRHEFLLVCTRGNCQPDVAHLVDSVQSIERSGKHSEKPQEFRALIDASYPYGNRIELFARQAHEGWEAWGNEPL